eukprot:6300753-Prymnesium_polylepis.1
MARALPNLAHAPSLIWLPHLDAGGFVRLCRIAAVRAIATAGAAVGRAQLGVPDRHLQHGDRPLVAADVRGPRQRQHVRPRRARASAAVDGRAARSTQVEAALPARAAGGGQLRP